MEHNIPEEYKPISAWGYFGYNLLFGIPLVGFIFLCVFALGGTNNVNLRNYSRSFFCSFIIGIVLLIIIFALAAVFGFTFNYLNY